MYLYILLMIASLPCFHSINIPSEWEFCKSAIANFNNTRVSIQLISPASGNVSTSFGSISLKTSRFHSINIPSEWEYLFKITLCLPVDRFHSINIPSEWELVGGLTSEQMAQFLAFRFHSINIPSEWESSTASAS